MRKLTQEEVANRFATNNLETLEGYRGAVTPILTRCLICKHERRVYPHSVFAGIHCPKCARQVRLTQSEVSHRFGLVGLEVLEPYTNNNIRILVRCTKCGHEKRIVPNFNGGYGCPKCANQLPLTADEVIKRFAAKGFEICEPYKDTRTIIAVRCTKCQRKRRVRPNHIFQGQGCAHCAEYGFQPSKPAVLYYVRLVDPFGDLVYKIGITNLTIRERFRKEFSKITIIETWHFTNGAEAFEMEQDVLKDYDADRYMGFDLLETGGNDELFTRDVLGLDKGAGQLELVA